MDLTDGKFPQELSFLPFSFNVVISSLAMPFVCVTLYFDRQGVAWSAPQVGEFRDI